MTEIIFKNPLETKYLRVSFSLETAFSENEQTNHQLFKRRHLLNILLTVLLNKDGLKYYISMCFLE